MLEIATAIGITTALVQAIKIGFKLPSRLAPIASIIVAISLTFLVNNDPLNLTIFNGIVIGLSASGLYAGTKKVVKG